MKNKASLLLLTLLFVFFSCNQSSENKDNTSDSSRNSDDLAQNQNLKLQIYYFHATNRCATCNSIETNVKQVLEDKYKEQVTKGLINLKVLCVDDETNKALVEKYEAAGASLHLVKIEKGIEKDNDLTEYAFSYSNIDPDYFMKGIQDTIQFFIQ